MSRGFSAEISRPGKQEKTALLQDKEEKVAKRRLRQTFFCPTGFLVFLALPAENGVYSATRMVFPAILCSFS